MTAVGPSKSLVPSSTEPKTIATASVNPNLPAFMQSQEHGLAGTEMLGQYITLPRLKIVQKMSGKPFSDLFNPGDVVAVPMTVQVAPVLLNDAKRPTDKGTPFYFVPLCFYPEWCVWNPLETKGNLPSIRERTLDPGSPWAVKSRSPQTWSFVCPEMPKNDKGEALHCRVIEHLNFICMILPPNPVAGVPVVMSFARAEHKAGSNLAALIKMRKAPIYGCQFQAAVGYRSNNKGNWFGIDPTNPSEESGITPFVTDEEAFNSYHTLHTEYYEAYKKGLLKQEYDDEVAEVVDEAKAEF